MRRKKNDLKLILVVLLLTISLGYAFLQTDLTINGTGKIAASSWDIHFEDLTPNPNSVTLSTGDVAATIDSTTRTDITYTITLKEPGDFYEFEVAIVNSGTIDAMIGTITNKLNGNEISTTNPLPAYLSYSVAYSDGVAIAPNQLLEAGNSETIKVRLAFRTDIDPSDLPTEGATNTLSFGLSYVQADDSAIADSTPLEPVSFATDSWETIIAAVSNDNTSAYSVGDTREFDLGVLGTYTLRLANKSTPSECATTGFSQTACGFVIEFADIITDHNMNSSATNVGGWPASSLRTYLNNDIYNAFPEVLKSHVIDTTVVSGHGSSDANNFTSTDKLYLLSFNEIWQVIGKSYAEFDSAYNSTRQLDYYASIYTVVRFDQGGDMYEACYTLKENNAVSSNWWLRTPSLTTNSDFVCALPMSSSEPYSNYGASQSEGVSPAFRIG